jgi:peptidoglycan hydrolase CwlO-like protein
MNNSCIQDEIEHLKIKVEFLNQAMMFVSRQNMQNESKIKELELQIENLKSKEE